MDQVKKLEIVNDRFMANGHEYILHKSLSINRFKEFQKKKIEVSLNLRLTEAKREFIKIFNYLNEQKLADASVIAHNMANGIEMLEKLNQDPVLLICALFFNRKGEDVRKVDNTLMNEKINDWAEEGYDINDFFYLANTLSGNFIPDFDEDSQPTSNPIKKPGPLKKEEKENK